MYAFINPAALLFTLATMFGVLIHDTQADRIALAVVIPATFASFIAMDTMVKSSEQHVHVERVSMPMNFAPSSATTARTHPRDDERHYNQAKKLAVGGFDNGYIWPSV